MHPHRGFDILTYILDGSDGFRHRDSLGGSLCGIVGNGDTIDLHTGGSKTYRGGSAQWMRTGAGAQHEEFWETCGSASDVVAAGVTVERAQV